MFKNLKLGTRLVIAFLLVGIIPFAIIGIVSMTKASNALENQAFNQLEAVREIKKEQIRTFFKTVENQMITFAENKMTTDAVFKFTEYLADFTFENNLDDSNLPGFKDKLRRYYENDFKAEFLKRSQGELFDVDALITGLSNEGTGIQYYYIAFNDNPVASKYEMKEAKDLSSYSRDAHRLYHPSFRNYMEKFGFEDILLINAENGMVVYSVSKRPEYGSSLKEGPFKDTHLGRMVQTILAEPKRGKALMADYALYAPAFNEPVSFIGAPVYEGEEMTGVAVFQISLASLNQIMSQRAGMGESGETYIVGEDLLMRSDSFINPKKFSAKNSISQPANGKILTEVVPHALKGESGKKVTQSYHGDTVLSAYAPIDIMGLKWALMAEISSSEAFKAIKTLKIVNAIIGIIGALIIGFIAFVISISITRPIVKVVNGLGELAQGEGDLTMRLTASGKDEIADLAHKFNAFMEKLQTMIKEVTNGVKTLSTSSNSLKEISTGMTNESMHTSAKSNTVASAAEELSVNMNSIAAAMEQSSTNTDTVATAANEMTTTISEIAQNTANAHSVTEDAVKQIHSATQKVLALGQAAQKIDKITETITDISEQTNLLALNATIEAARAGEAGRGFAVVANEIKALARQTAQATLDIQQQINDVQNSTSSTASSIDEISRVIVGINDIVNVISAAVEEQSASTNEIVENINQTAHGIAEITGTLSQGSIASTSISEEIADVNRSANEITQSSSQVKESAEELSALAESLNELVGKFKV
ncbi:MAG: methyl-accepting chemotaxis protein [Pseudomonadota bacterium]